MVTRERGRVDVGRSFHGGRGFKDTIALAQVRIQAS